MHIPVTYNLRNLKMRKLTSLMTALGAALSVVVLVSVLALLTGLRTSFEVTGDESHLLVLRNSSASELVSQLSRQNFTEIISHPGIQRDQDGHLMASLEMITVVSVDLRNGGEMNVNLRGMNPVGWQMRGQIKLASGRMFQTGAREIVVGRAIAARCDKAHLGGTLEFGNGAWKVVGIMDGGGSAFNSEIFADLNQVTDDYHRPNVLSSVLLAVEPGQMDRLMKSLAEDRRLPVTSQPERRYYYKQMDSALPVSFMGIFVAIVMAVVSVFASMNTMYAAVARRTSEIGVLRVLGFSSGAVLISFLLESIFISLFGGCIGCLLTLPLNRIETAIGSFNTWNQLTFNFHVTPAILIVGLLFAIAIGAIGGFLPARSASRKPLISALRAH